MLRLALDAKLEGEVDIALRYPKNHSEGALKLCPSWVPNTLCVCIDEDADFNGESIQRLMSEPQQPLFRQLLEELLSVANKEIDPNTGKIRKEATGMAADLIQEEGYFAGMVQFTRYVVTGIVPPGIYISAMNIHADAKYMAKRLMDICQDIPEIKSCHDVLRDIDVDGKGSIAKHWRKKLNKSGRSVTINNIICRARNAAKFLMDYAALTFGIKVDVAALNGEKYTNYEIERANYRGKIVASVAVESADVDKGIILKKILARLTRRVTQSRKHAVLTDAATSTIYTQSLVTARR